MHAPHSKPHTTLLKEYRAPDYLVEAIDLHFELGDEQTIVHSQLKLCRNSSQGRHQRPLELQGEDLKLVSILLDDRELTTHDYILSPTTLTIPNLPDHFVLQIVTQIYPHKNTALSGLYRSGKLFCTQCEAQGFRKITYYMDRPDVMAPFTTTIVADKTHYPVLLSNGNKIESGELSDNRHWAKWQDPFKKPCYLFALVAGDLAQISDKYTTQSGRNVALEIYVEPENINKCEHAMRSLKNSMQWDEKAYGREYDLDIYMIVAVNDFNMGAMENKGLNIFNSKYILADEKTATDQDFQNVESVIGHEYFHNWTGNRVTCRDWFQLSLKEGLTVFREQQFSAKMGSPAVKRIQDVRVIRTRQFAEDIGPMAHPVRPDSYIEINNFYTMTIYYKGAEVIRMLHTLLGEKRFRKGMDLYFERHDGQAVTIEDFVAAFADANDYDLRQFHRWYNQAGTPLVKATGEYDATKKQYTLTLTQSCPPTPDQKEKKPFLIPIKIGLYDEQGSSIVQSSKTPMITTEAGEFLILDKEEAKFIFDKVPSKPIPSLLGNFSAPVKLEYPYTSADLVVLMTHDNDLFNRWDASQRLVLAQINTLMTSYLDQKPLNVSSEFIGAYRQLLQQPYADPHLFAQMLIVPSFNYVAEDSPIIQVDALKAARTALLDQLAKDLQGDFEKIYHASLKADDGTISSHSMGHRALKNTCLHYLVRLDSRTGRALAQSQYQQAKNMTDMMGALAAINQSTHETRQTMFDDFYAQFKHDPLVVNKWLSLNASSELPNALANIKALTQHEAFDVKNPNKVYALINTFGSSNPERFHDAKGEGYDFIAQKVIELNKQNPQVAARVIEPLTQWKRLDAKHGQLMKQALVKIQTSGELSEDIYEVVTKSLIG